MEKVIYRNKQNGKVGTLVRKNDKFKQFILEVDGQNVPYSSATIKRWWEVIENTLPEVSKTVTDTTEKINTEEITSVSEPKAEASVSIGHTKDTHNSPQSKKRQQKPNKKSKETSPTSKTKGPDMEVFSYIKKQAKDAGYTLIQRKDSKNYSNGRWILLGLKKKDKVVCVEQIYLANNHIKILVSSKKASQLNQKLLKQLDYTTRKGINLDLAYTVNYSGYEKFVTEFLKLKNL